MSDGVAERVGGKIGSPTLCSLVQSVETNNSLAHRAHFWSELIRQLSLQYWLEVREYCRFEAAVTDSSTRSKNFLHLVAPKEIFSLRSC